jgi:hypothetical protein
MFDFRMLDLGIVDVKYRGWSDFADGPVWEVVCHCVHNNRYYRAAFWQSAQPEWNVCGATEE